MKKVTAGAAALALAGLGSVALAGPGGAQSVEDIPTLPGNVRGIEVSGGMSNGDLREIQLDRAGFSYANITQEGGATADGCTLADGQVAAALAIEIWNFDAEGEPQLLESGYLVAETRLSGFWGEDITEYFSEAELERWNRNTLFGIGESSGGFQASYEPPAVNGQQVFVGHCIVVDESDSIAEYDSVDDLERSGEAFVGTYLVSGGAGGDDGDGGNGGDGGGDDTPPADEDPGTTPPAPPVSGQPTLTG
jgi:hypothetical protein